MDQNTGIIYCYLNKVTGKRYIGQTINPEQRKSSHLSEAINEKYDYYFHRSIRKHGWDKFEYSVLETVDRKDLNDRENFFINQFNTLWPNGYNQCMANALDETAIEKMRQTNKARFASMTKEERLGLVRCMIEKNTGSKHSDETKRKMSESAKQYLAANPRVRSEETKRKTSESMKRARANNKNWSTKKKEEAEASS